MLQSNADLIFISSFICIFCTVNLKYLLLVSSLYYVYDLVTVTWWHSLNQKTMFVVFIIQLIYSDISHY